MSKHPKLSKFMLKTLHWWFSAFLFTTPANFPNSWLVYFKLILIDVTLQKEACVKQDKYRRPGPSEFDEFIRENEVAKEKTGFIVRQCCN